MLKHVSRCHSHPRDSGRLKTAKILLRSTKRKRKQPDSESPSVINPVSLQDIFSQHEFTLLFFFHPRHKHSIQLRSIVSDFCARDDTSMACLAMFGGIPEAASKEEIDDCELFFEGTGFLEISRGDEEGQKACASLLKFLDVTGIPSVVVVPNSRGRPIFGQELALEWNASAPEEEIQNLLQRFRDGNAGLTLSQSLVSKILGDSSTTCVLM